MMMLLLCSYGDCIFLSLFRGAQGELILLTVVKTPLLEPRGRIALDSTTIMDYGQLWPTMSQKIGLLFHKYIRNNVNSPLK
jgi:hypothetical protein